jgi:hypothetical protein
VSEPRTAKRAEDERKAIADAQKIVAILNARLRRPLADRLPPGQSCNREQDNGKIIDREARPRLSTIL